MKFSYLLSAFLATLSIASPLPNPEPAEITDLDARNNKVHYVDTAEYTAAAAAAHSHSLTKDDWYYFTVEKPLGANIPDDKESKTELQKLQKKLGFEHIYVVVGQVVETKTGKGKNEKIKRDFRATMYDMIKKDVNPGNTKERVVNWKAQDEKKLKYGGKTTSKKGSPTNVKKIAKDYIADHKIYNVDGNNCNDFAQHIIKKL